MMAFKDVHVHRKCAFADVTEDLEVERLSWIIWVDPINHMDLLGKREADGSYSQRKYRSRQNIILNSNKNPS